MKRHQQIHNAALSAFMLAEREALAVLAEIAANELPKGEGGSLGEIEAEDLAGEGAE